MFAAASATACSETAGASPIDVDRDEDVVVTGEFGVPMVTSVGEPLAVELNDGKCVEVLESSDDVDVYVEAAPTCDKSGRVGCAVCAIASGNVNGGGIP